MTGQEVFDIAIHKLDEQNESTGTTVTTDTRTYLLRSVSILNSIFARISKMICEPYTKISSMEDEIPFDDATGSGLIAVWLAYELIRTEDDELSAILFSEVRDAQADIIPRSKLAESEEIEDVYGGVNPYNEFSSW